VTLHAPLAIHPTEAQSLVECVQVRYRCHTRVELMEDEPHLGLGVVMLVEPLVPLISGLGGEGFHGLLSVGSDEVFRAVRPSQRLATRSLE